MSDNNTKNINTKKEIEKRRTFAIISHPDAGKTTLTERIVLLACMKYRLRTGKKSCINIA